MKKIQKSIYPGYKLSKTLALLIPSLLSLSLIVFQVLNYMFKKELIASIAENLVDSIKNDKGIDIDGFKDATNELLGLLENGSYDSLGYIISIIGIAVSVWVGLNIYNTIEKSDLRELHDKVNDIINAQIESQDKNLANSQKEYKLLQLITFLETNPVDSATPHFIEHFKKIDISEWNINTISTMINIEHSLYSYDKNNSSKYSIDAVKKLESVQNELNNESSCFLNGNHKILNDYYYYKLGDIQCRLGMEYQKNKSNYNDAKNYFQKSIDNYIKSQQNKYEFISVDNGIGLCKLRLSKMETNLRKKADLANESIKHLRIACDKKPDFKYALGNLGAAYEVLEDYDNAIICYKSRIEQYPFDYYGRYLLASVYLKQVSKALEFSNRNKLFNTTLSLPSNIDTDNLNEYLLLAEKTIDTAKILDSSKQENYYIKAEINTFKILIYKYQKKDINTYVVAANDYFHQSNMIDANNLSSLRRERDYNEVVDRIATAFEINSKLPTNRQNTVLANLYMDHINHL